MKAEIIMDALKDVAPNHEVTDITIKGDEVCISSRREIKDSSPKIEKTQLCDSLANMTVKKFQDCLHTSASINRDMIPELIVVEQALRKTNRALKMYEDLKRGR